MFGVYLALIVFVMFLSKGIKIIMDYDAWLEKPYQDEREARDNYDTAAELFVHTDSYWESYEEWAMELFKNGVPCSTEVWHDTDDFRLSVENYLDRLNAPPDPPEDREYRTRGWG